MCLNNLRLLANALMYSIIQLLGVARGMQYLHSRNPPVLHGNLNAVRSDQSTSDY